MELKLDILIAYSASAWDSSVSLNVEVEYLEEFITCSCSMDGSKSPKSISSMLLFSCSVLSITISSF